MGHAFCAPCAAVLRDVHARRSIDELSHLLQDEFARLRNDEQLMYTWFVPMRNPRVNLTNPSLHEYMLWNNLELAPVSFSARKYVHTLRKLGVEADDWRDRFSQPLLLSAVKWNYVALVKWLIAQGCDVDAPDLGDTLVEIADKKEFKTLAKYLRQQLAATRAAADGGD